MSRMLEIKLLLLLLLLALLMILVDAIHMSLKVSYIFIVMTSFTNMHVWFGRLVMFPDSEHRIMI